MDISQTYIKMCEKAFPDIGEIETISVDFGYIPRLWAIKNGSREAKQYNLFAQKAKPEGDFFQVYFRDQLQEMADADWRISFCDLWDWIENKQFSEPCWISREGCKLYSSVEQLWLAFVMSKKFNKQWDDEKWVTAHP